jgi:predicted TIM-barrel fold metal-dependent hydrolase
MIIDIHTHLFVDGWVPKEFFHGVARFITHENAKQGIIQSNEEVGDYLLQAGSDPDAEMLLSEMAEAGIDKSVIFPVDFGLTLGDPEVPIDEVNRLYAELGRKHPDKLIPFASVDPRRDGAADLFEKCVSEWNMKGLKLHPCAGFYPNQKEVYPLLEIANHKKLPVIIHSGHMMVPLRSKYSQTIHLDDLGVDFPDLPIIAAHAGGSFGYKQLLSLMGIKVNIMADISSWQVYVQKDYPGFCRILREFIDFTETERIFFGSDSPSFRSMMSNMDWVQLVKDLPNNAPEGIDFTEAEINLILGGNAQRILGLS